MYVYSPIDISDKLLFDRCIKLNPCRSCDCSFTNLYTWKDRYQTQVAQYKGYLWARYREPNGRVSYMMPLCLESPEIGLKELLMSLMAEAEEGNYPFVMQGITREMYTRIETVLPRVFAYTPIRNDFDYLYYSDDLIRLSGKKYQSKRNHIHKLLELPNCEYRALQPEDVPACMEMTKRWIRQNHSFNEEFQQSVEAENENTIAEELQAIQCAFSHWSELSLKGGVLLLSGKIVAYTYGQAITEDTFGVHIEKADSEVEGAYPLINKYFAEQVAAHYTYINREEDMGLPGLRKAKLSYHPVELIEKGELSLAVSTSKQSPETMIATPDMRAEIRSLWKTCFGDTNDFLDPYFKYKYREGNTLIMRLNDCIIASLQMLPYYYDTIRGERVQIAYMSGLCTLPEHRRRGYMEHLLHESFRLMSERGIRQSLLIPENTHLIKYYEKFGYKVVYSYSPQAPASLFTLDSSSANDLTSLDNDSAADGFESLCMMLISQYADREQACVCMQRIENSLFVGSRAVIKG